VLAILPPEAFARPGPGVPRGAAVAPGGQRHAIVSTTRKRAAPLVMRATASFARASGKVSTIGRTPVAAAKRSVSSESLACPLGQPWTD
jgi:hypothetical protein